MGMYNRIKFESYMYILAGFALNTSLNHVNWIYQVLLAHLRWGPQGFWESGENGYLFSGSLGALVIIFRDLGSKLIVLVI